MVVHRSVLLGRSNECEVLDRLIDAVRAGESRTLVLHGEPGVGKTALLQYVEDRATGCRLARAAGVQSEMEIAFAGLHQLCAPLLERLDELPGPQRGALRTTFGLSAGEVPDRFLVGLAILGLLASAAEQQPLVCLIDDAQWLDRSSEQALAFAARRLLAEPVALIFARRDPGAAGELTGLRRLPIGGLAARDARALLSSVVSGPLDERVRDRIIAETRGNPLALLELPRAMTPAELASGFGLPDAHALQGRIEESFRQRVDALPADSQRLLLVAAAEPTGDPVVVWAAAQRLGIAVDSARPAAATNLLQLGYRIRFTHPLVRSAVYNVASRQERQAVHRALAEVTDPALDPDRRAWHRGCAASVPDDEVADELERSASRAQARGGFAATASFLSQAAELTSDAARNAKRYVAAAQAHQQAGALDTALALLEVAESGPLPELMRVRVDLLRAQIVFAGDRGREAPQLLIRAAQRLEPLDPALARETYLDALFAALFADRLADPVGPQEVAVLARAAPPPGSAPTVAGQFLDGLSALVTDGYVAAAPMLRRALDAFSEGGLPDELWLRWVPHAAHTALLLWDFERWQAIADRQVRAARDGGALVLLPISLSSRIAVHAFAGQLTAAAALADEVQNVAEATRGRAPSYGAVIVAAWRGVQDGAVEPIESAAGEQRARGEGLGVTIVQWARAVLCNGLGRHAEALSAAQLAAEDPPRRQRAAQGISNWALIELVEAAALSGDTDRAAAALERLSERTRASGTDWALGIEARSRGLVRHDEGAFHESIERLSRSGVGAFAARSHLIYGEWLRSARRRTEARHQLRTAHEQFSAMGLSAFAERAARALRAAGETTGTRTIEATRLLTTQEAQVARMARDGLSNSDIGARLFITPRTVQYHLHKVFAKFSISSRDQLSAVLEGDAPG